MLLSKSRAGGTAAVWMIDPNPQDIGMIDFYRPDGTPVAVVRGDPRQLNDATFHAGTNSGSEYEYVDTFNWLHFYVLAKHRNGSGVLFYDVGVRRHDGRPVHPGRRARQSDQDAAAGGLPRHVLVPADEHRPGGHGHLRLGRLPALAPSSSSDDWKVTLPNALAAAKAGPDGADPRARAAGSAHGRR